MIRKHIARALRAEQRSAQLAVHRPAGQPEPAGAQCHLFAGFLAADVEHLVRLRQMG